MAVLVCVEHGTASSFPCRSIWWPASRCACHLQSFILLHEALAVLPPLAEALAAARCELLRAVGAACGHAAFGELRGELQAVLEEDVRSAKSAFLNRWGLGMRCRQHAGSAVLHAVARRKGRTWDASRACGGAAGLVGGEGRRRVFYPAHQPHEQHHMHGSRGCCPCTPLLPAERSSALL